MAASRQAGDPRRAAAMEAAVRYWSPLAVRLSARYRARVREPEDLEQVALTALVQAVVRYRPDRGPFLAYAVPTITGEIRHWLRDGSRSVRVPRPLLELAARAAVVEDELTQQLGVAPTTRQVADGLRVPADELAQARRGEAARWPVPAEAARESMASLGHVDRAVDHVEARLDVHRYLACLDQRARRLLYLRYYQGWTQERIAADLGVSQVHVSRMLTTTLGRLRREAGVAVQAGGPPAAWRSA